MGSSFEDLVATSPTVKTDHKSDKRFELPNFLNFGAERFTEEQLRFLVDFADASPPKCRTRITFRTALHDEVERLRWLEGSSAVCSALEVPPLSEAEVHEWLELARLPASLAPAATRGSGGYPLHLVDWISQQQKGEPVSPPRQAHFAEITKRSWAALGSATRRSAARLVVLNDPLPSEQLARLVGVDEDQWASLVEELALARLLSVRIEGQLWFHEERRAAIFEVLTDEERERNHARAVSFLAELVSAEGDDALLAELALQVENVATLREDPRIDALFGLAPAELSVLTAALELAEPGIGGSVGVFEVLSHWGDRWKRGDDPGLALQTLVLKDVVRVVPSDSGPLIDLGGERLWYLAAAGVCRVRLGRPVVRSISSYLFKSVVAPAAVGLVGARYGVGRLSFSYMADLARSVSSRPDAPVLAARLSYGSTSFYACVSFQSAHDRNLAHHALQAAGERYALEERVRLREALDLPTGRFRTKGFLAALDRVRPDKTSRTASNPSSTDPSEWLELRAEATDVFAEIALGAEALAGEATGGARFLWTQTDDRYLEIELRGDGPRAQRIPEAHLAGVSDLFEVASPTFVERLTEELGVDAVLRRVSVGRLPDVRADPVRFQFQEIVDQFRAFNRSQQAVVVTVESEELTSAIAAAISARWELATRLYQALSARGLAVDPLEPRRHEVLVVLDRPMRSWVAGAHAWIRCSQWPATSDRDEVNVRCVEGILARDKRNSFRFELPPDAEDKHSWRDWEGALGGSDAVFDHGIAELLGYEVDDVTTTWLSELGA